MVGITKWQRNAVASRQLKSGALLSYAGVVFNAVAGLLYTPWMIQSIGSSNYGLYTLAISVINFFLLDFGLGDAVSRFLSKYYAEGREDLADAFLGVVYKIYFLGAACIAIALIVIFLFIDQIYGNLTPEELSTFKVLYAVIALYSVISFPFTSFNGILTANEKFFALNLCNLLQKICTVGLIVLALICGMGVFALVAVNAISSLSFVVVKYIVIKKTTRVSPTFKNAPKGLAKETLGFSFWAMIVQICQRFIFSVMPTILAAVSNSWEIAVFGLASSLEGYVWTVANALNGMFMPKVSRVLAGKENEGTLQNLTMKLGRIQLYVVGGVVVAFAAIGMRFVECWVGPDYSVLFACTLLLIAPDIIDLPLMIANTAIIASGEVRARGIVYIVMSALNIALGFPLAMGFGALGACASICIAYFVRTAGMCLLYKKKLDLNLSSFAKATYPKWIIVSIAVFLASSALSSWLQISGWPGFAITAVVFVVLYCVLCFLIAFNQYEKNLALSVIGRFTKKGR